MPETLTIKNSIETKDAPLFDYLVESRKFLGGYFNLFGNEELKQIYLDSVQKFKNQNINSKINYNKYNKEFCDENKKIFSRGEIIASRHFGFNFGKQNFDPSDQLIKKQTLGDYNKLSARDIYLRELNIKLSESLSTFFKSKDLSKSNDYKLTEKRLSKTENQEEKQLGFLAEQLMIATFERLIIDRNDLSLDIYPANAYQDINDKIDFIISSKNKSRGIGTTIGIQFTTNPTVREHKEDQVDKAKKRNKEVDDILIIVMEKETLLEAENKWNKNGRDISGPWKYLPRDVRATILQSVLKSLLEDDIINSIIKKELELLK